MNSTDNEIQDEVLDSKTANLLGNYAKWAKDNSVLLRFGVGFAVVASMLSFAIGLISGVAFFTVFIRAIIVSLIFFIFGVGIFLFLQYIVPDIFTNTANAKQTGDEKVGNLESSDNVGANIDYTIDEDASSQEGSGANVKEDYKNSALDNKDPSFGDNKVADFNIPQDPMLLAKAVKTVFDRDD